MIPAYTMDFACRDSEPLQQLLNDLYDYRDDVETKVLHRCRLHLFRELVQRLVKAGEIRRFGRALDIGCNAGYYSKLISDFGFATVVGVDIVDEYVQKARATFGSEEDGRRIEFRTLNAEDLDPRETFDFILCTEVIEHTSSPQRVIENISRMLGPGGVAVVTLPNRVSLPYSWSLLTHRLKGKPIDPVLRDHLSYPFYRSMRLFDGRGLRLIDTTGTNLFLFGPILARLYSKPGFGAIGRFNYLLSGAWPFKYAAQFFFMALKNEESVGAGDAGYRP